jgi:ribosome biogenesis GTPase / thiamine phosphate phosphatase
MEWFALKVRKGLILTGINNIFTVQSEADNFLCEIKGKVLKDLDDVYNPLAAGDIVSFVVDDLSDKKGMIIERLKRRNEFSRWNNKRNSPQTIAANIDYLICVTSAGNPPFRPRFVDRVLVMADSTIRVLIVLNKSDLGIDRKTKIRMDDYRRIGYEVICCSAETGDNMDSLKKTIKGKIAAFIGQSGVGKSSLLNLIYPGHELKTGAVSVKYNRGRHTTNYSKLVFEGNGGFIDTPGIREIEIFGINPEDLGCHFYEFEDPGRNCRFKPCLHNKEPDCKVRQAVDDGTIHKDRFESYLRILKSLQNSRGKAGNYG